MLSNEMLIERAGNFTASENHRLMAGWDAQQPDRNFDGYHDLYPLLKRMRDKGESKPLVGPVKKLYAGATGDLITATWKAVVFDDPTPGAGLVTYAEEKACETLFEPDPMLNFSTAHTRNGEEREPECVALAAKATGKMFVHVGDDQIHVHADQVGVTPDGVVFDSLDLIETGIEAKCKSPLVHARNLMINSNKDLLDEEFEHYTQIQTAMLVTGAERWLFANYQPYAKKESHQFKCIWIERDDSFIEILSQRVELAKRIKAEFLQKFYASVDEIEQEKAA